MSTLRTSTFVVAIALLGCKPSDDGTSLNDGVTTTSLLPSVGTQSGAGSSVDSVGSADGSTATWDETISTLPGSTSNGGAKEDSQPQFVPTACGSFPVQRPNPSFRLDVPTRIDGSQPFFGHLEPSSSGPSRHFWAVELKRGDYHVVLDATQPGSSTDDWIIVETVLDTGLSKKRMIWEGTSDSILQSRLLGELSVDSDRTEVVAVGGARVPLDYTLAIIPKSSPVPSPRFSDCPSIRPIELSAPVEFAPENEVWFELDLEEGDYTAAVEITVDQAERDTVCYLDVLDVFGQNEGLRELMSLEGQVQEPGEVSRHEETFSVRISGKHWIRVFETQNLSSISLSVRKSGNLPERQKSRPASLRSIG